VIKIILINYLLLLKALVAYIIAYTNAFKLKLIYYYNIATKALIISKPIAIFYPRDRKS